MKTDALRQRQTNGTILFNPVNDKVVVTVAAFDTHSLINSF